MGEVVQICVPDRSEFTWAEANALLPLVKRLFERHLKQINKYLSELKFYVKSGAPQHVIAKCDDDMLKEMSTLSSKLHKLGCKVLGNGYIGFDSGVFYWSFNGQTDTELNHNHAYEEGPELRRQIKVFGTSTVIE